MHHLCSGEIEKAECCGFLNRSEAADLKIQRLPIQKPLVNLSLFQTQVGTLAPFPATNRDGSGEKDIRTKKERPSTRVSQTSCVANVLASITQAAERLCSVCCTTHQAVVSYRSLSSTTHQRRRISTMWELRFGTNVYGILMPNMLKGFRVLDSAQKHKHCLGFFV